MPITRTEAARFLTQATFGPSKAGIDELVELGSYEKWIDQQFAKTPSLTEPFVRATQNGSRNTGRHYIWWENAIRGEDQLRQRLAFAWSELFVVSDLDYELSNSQYGMCNYYDMLATMADGTYRELLEAVTLHPVMGIYLSMVRNEKADPSRNVRPDENFAREVLQLFSIGLHELKLGGRPRTDADGVPIPTFDQETVEEFAKVFTGWNFAGTARWEANTLAGAERELPMVPVEEFHDRTAKRLLNGVTIPAGGTARSDLTAALDNIAGHFNVGPFIAETMIKRLVTSNPSWTYIKRVAIAFNRGRYNGRGSGRRGDLVALTKAVLLDREARVGHLNRRWRFGKFKEPVMRLTQLWRAFDAVPGPETGNYRTTRTVDQLNQLTSQAVMESPSVFNFFRPDYPLGHGTLKAPERQILTEINIASVNNMLFSEVYENNNILVSRDRMTRLIIDDEVALAGNIDALLDHLDVLLLAGGLTPRVRGPLAAHLASHPNDEEGRLARTLDAIYCLVGSPIHLVQK